MQVEYEFTVPDSVDTVRRIVTDVDRSVACVPGLTVESAGPGQYGGRLRLRVGSTTVTYRGTGRVTSHAGEIATVELDGQEARGGGTAKGVVKLLLAGDQHSTSVTVEADLAVDGRLGELEPAVQADLIRRLFVRFGECVVAAAAGAGEPLDQEPAGAPEPDAQLTSPVEAGAHASVAEHQEPQEEDLIAPSATQPAWRLWPMLPLLAVVAGVGIIIELLRRRRVR